MKIKKGLLVLAFLTISILSLPPKIYAHPGRTASDGCHYCRTNCDKWGVPWNERHCHEGTINIPPATVSNPSPTPKPIISTPTPIPSPTSTPTPTLTPTLTPTPTPTITTTLSPQASPTNTPNPTVTTKTKKASGFWGWFLSLFSR